MRRRLVVTTLLISVAAVLVLGIPLGIVESHRARSDEVARLERQADEIAAALDDRIEREHRLPAAEVAPYARGARRVDVVTRYQHLRVGAVPPGSTVAARSSTSQTVIVTVTRSAEAVTSRQRNAWLLIAALAVAGSAAAAGLALVQARRLVRPLDRLIATSDRLGSGDFSARAGPLPVAELDRLAHALDSAAAQIAQLVGRQGEFAANVSHQLRSPLTGLQLRLDEITRLVDSDEARAEAEAAIAVADRLEATVSDLLALARAGDLGEAQDLDLAAIAAQHAESWKPVFARSRRPLVIDIDGQLPVRVSRGGIAQALDVLLENALTHGGGATELAARRDGPRAVLEVSDSGAGVPESLEEEIFRRSVSTRGSTGLGLPLARALVETDGARLELASARPARFQIIVPLRPGSGNG
jgi:signal transduction histidine kinase